MRAASIVTALVPLPYVAERLLLGDTRTAVMHDVFDSLECPRPHSSLTMPALTEPTIIVQISTNRESSFREIGSVELLSSDTCPIESHAKCRKQMAAAAISSTASGGQLDVSETVVPLSMHEATDTITRIVETSKMHQPKQAFLRRHQEEVTRRFWWHRNAGFPTIKEMDHDAKIRRLLKLRTLQPSRYCTPDVEARFLSANMCVHGVSALLWQYFPHYITVNINDSTNAIEAFLRDRTLVNCIVKSMMHEQPDTQSRIRSSLSNTNGTQVVSNFPVQVAAAVYKHWGGAGGTVWDMSGGWGGRLLGAAWAGVKTYHATEPSSLTFSGLQKLAEDSRVAFPNTEILLHKHGSEDFVGVVAAESVDLCFTSPPYFSQEKYSMEATQSAVKFPFPTAWINGFMRQTLQNCFDVLKPNGFCILNIESVRRYPTLVRDTEAVAASLGFLVHPMWKMGLATTQTLARTESVLVFQKPPPSVTVH